MVQSYTNNPKFGDVTKFKSELETAVYNVQVLEADLHSKERCHKKNGTKSQMRLPSPLTV